MKRTRHYRSKRAGSTLIEVMVSATISLLVLGGAVALMVAGSSAWYKGEGKMLAESQSQRAVRAMSMRLREAMGVNVANDGMSVSFRLPQLDGNGGYVTPAVWDGVSRSFSYNDGRILLTEGGNTKVVCRNVILTDPQSTNGTAAYVPFAKGAGAITRQMSIMLVTQTNTTRGESTKSRSRETVYLRNIPELSRG